MRDSRSFPCRQPRYSRLSTMFGDHPVYCLLPKIFDCRLPLAHDSQFYRSLSRHIANALQDTAVSVGGVSDRGAGVAVSRGVE